MAHVEAPATTKAAIAAALAEARERTLALVEPVPVEELLRQHAPIMSPLVWDLAHVGHYEELWLVRALTGERPLDEHHDEVYDAFRHVRAERPSLRLLDPDEARAYLARVRARALEVLDSVEVDGGDPLLAGGFVYGLVLQHELQHQETMLQTLALRAEPYPLPPAVPVPVSPPDAAEVGVPGGRVVLGTDDPWAYDNERPAHAVELPPFRLDATPVTNRAYAAFVADGGYATPSLWAEEGRRFLAETGARHPLGWRPEGEGGWSCLRFGHREPLPPDEPVQHVSWFEADAFARWAGRRLPTEAEWEAAASRSDGGVKLRYPWGDEPPAAEHANLGWRRFAPAPAGAFPAGRSPDGAAQLVGDVWEWTASDFRPYPGFRAFPYREYSEPFFGPGYRVLRGGSWATSPGAIRATFRNWDLPVRRQLFAGFRCARDA